MRSWILLSLVTLASVATVAADTTKAKPAKFHLTSAEIAPGRKIGEAQVFQGFGCSGGNASPQLEWRNAPAGTKSFALMVHDPDAPTGSGWWHWVVYNIPAGTFSIAAGAGTAEGKGLPAGAQQGVTDFGVRGYGGPCPPPGSKPHRYYFRLHALKVAQLDVPANATAALIGYNVNGNTLAVAEIMALYSR
jgi:Raf kinase inhibitor-like YbhB/YbcL family protein